MSDPVMPKTISDRLQDEARRKRRDTLWNVSHWIGVLARLIALGVVGYWLLGKLLGTVPMTVCLL